MALSTRTPVDEGGLKLCPTCGHTTPASRNRCHHCWNEVVNARILDPVEAERRMAQEEAEEVARLRREEERRRRAHAIRLVGVAMLVGLFGWWGYRAFIYEPPPVPTPSSTERAVVTGADAWPLAGGDFGGTRSTEASARLAGDLAWTADLGSAVATELITDGERIYVALVDGRVVAADIEDGSELWTHRLQNFPLAAPTIAGDRLYVPLRQGALLALDAATGEVAFETEAQEGSFASSPLVSDGMAYLFGTGHLYGFDAETGEQLWDVEIPSNWAFVTPILSDEYLGVATGNRTLVFDRFSGQETYFYEFERAHPYSISTSDGSIFTLSSRFGAAFEIEARRPWWEGWRAAWNQFWLWGMAPSVPPPPSEWVTSRPPRDGYPVAVGGDRLFLASPVGDFRALNRTTGEAVWRTEVPVITAAPLLTADGVLLTHRDALVLYDTADGTERARRDIDGERLRETVVTTGGTYVATESGRILALR